MKNTTRNLLTLAIMTLATNFTLEASNRNQNSCRPAAVTTAANTQGLYCQGECADGASPIDTSCAKVEASCLQNRSALVYCECTN